MTLRRPFAVAVDRDAVPISARVSGEFDLAATTEVADAIRPHLDGLLVVDLSEVTFLDSSGVRCLSDLRAEAGELGGRLELGALSPRARAVLDLLGRLTGRSRPTDTPDGWPV